MGKQRVPRTRASGTMTDAQFRGRIISALRNASKYWKPIQDVRKASRLAKGTFLCNICKQICLTKIDGENNQLIDHVHPIIDPLEGFVGFDRWIERCFVEVDGFQALCGDCHRKKTTVENELRKEFR
jgi:5-methylcytosine-specific restriction endonuclease McrA